MKLLDTKKPVKISVDAKAKLPRVTHCGNLRCCGNVRHCGNVSPR